MKHKNDILHYGIKGMQWGVRRKRNSSTGRVESDDSKAARRLKGKSVREMSNEELRTLTNRMQLEQQYSNLKSSSISPGKKFVQEVVKDSGKKLAKNYVSKAGEAAIEALIKLSKEKRK